MPDEIEMDIDETGHVTVRKSPPLELLKLASAVGHLKQRTFEFCG